jgi:hypothetical protein
MNTIFKGVEISREAVEKALEDYHRRDSSTKRGKHRLDQPVCFYAIHYEGSVYPPKHILSMVSGIPAEEFHGGEETNRVFRQLGFEVGLI